MNKIITKLLTVDHDRLDILFKAYPREKNTNPPLAAALFKKFSSGLNQHIEWEEKLLFPLFERATGNTHGGPTFVMRSEHQQIKALLAHIAECIDSANGTDEYDTQLLQLLQQHNEKEERVLYPTCDQMIGPQEIEKILLDI